MHPTAEKRSGRKQYHEYAVGDTIGTDTIETIYYFAKNFIIYETPTGALVYDIVSDEKSSQIVAEFNRAQIDLRKQLRGTNRDDRHSLLATCLNAALLSPNDDPKEHFAPVRLFIQERGPIEYVYGHSSTFIVYLNNRRQVVYDYDDELPSSLIPRITEFHRLQHIANCSLQTGDRDEVISILGMDLVEALRSSGDADSSALFLSSKEFITNRSEAVLRSRYIGASVIASAVFLALLTPTIFYLNRNSIDGWIILLGSAGGVIGATISIIQRGIFLKVNPFVPLSHVIFQGTVRIVLGVIFGALLIVASKAGIVLGTLVGNTWSLFILSVVAGFSERFIPDLLARFGTEGEAETPQQNGG